MIYPPEIFLGRSEADAHAVTMLACENVSLYAKTRSGKTTSFVIPNAFHYSHSLVVLDIKRQVFDATAGHRKNVLGQDVYLLDPAAEDGCTHCWNPLSGIERDAWDVYDQISRIAYLLFPESQAIGGSTNTDKFWEPAARAAFTAVTTLIAETPSRDLTLASVLEMFARGDGADIIVNWIKRRRRQARLGAVQYSQAAVNGISDFLAGNLDQVEGIRKMVSTRLQPFFNPRIVAATSRSDFDLRDLRRKPMTIYVAVSPANIGRLRPYLALFFEQLVNLNVDKTPEQDPSLKYRALIMLDEFSRLGRMETLADAAQFSAGYGMQFAYVVQNKEQVVHRYGGSAAIDIFDNVGAELAFGTNDHKMCKELSDRYGDTTISGVTQNRPRYGALLQPAKQTEAEHPYRRPVKLPQEIARMSSRQQILFRVGMPPADLIRTPWFEDPAFRDLRQTPPVIPTIKWTSPRDDNKTRIVRLKPRAMGGISEQDTPPEVEDGT